MAAEGEVMPNPQGFTAATEAFIFRVFERDLSWFATVWNRISGSYDTSGKPHDAPEWGPFNSEQEAKDWALGHARENLKQPDTELVWE